ncbi:MAG: prepilin-type N-terminal cleavage/methylation domain-containing protein [Candidatus Rokubacteria bacterium]|nr:prepilin-type N-terminal cleavage/methylation domain-containing protein [Candidatus Rokubacteria bacterium]
MNNQRGFSLIELTLASVIGVVVLLGVFSLYLATTSAFNQSSSHAYLQRQGTLAVDAIARRVRGASAIARSCTPAAPGGTTGRVVEITLSAPNPEAGAYCYYAGNGLNGAEAGVLCERFTPSGGATGLCRNLLAGPQASLLRQTGQTGITLIQQTTPADTRCPRNTRYTTGVEAVPGGEAIAAGEYCLALSVGPPAPVTPADTNADIAFFITDGVDGMAFSVSLTRRN